MGMLDGLEPGVDPTQKIAIPPLRTFVVTRYKPDGDGIEQIAIHAHSQEFGDAGVVSFKSMREDAASPYGVVIEVHRAFNEWIDVEEIRTKGITH